MTRVSDATTDCRGEVSCHDRLAACAFGSLGWAGVNAVAAWAGDWSRRAAGRRAGVGGERHRPLEQVAIATIPEISVSEALSDPIVRTLMAADGVDPAELEERLGALAKKLARRYVTGTAGAG